MLMTEDIKLSTPTCTETSFTWLSPSLENHSCSCCHWQTTCSVMLLLALVLYNFVRIQRVDVCKFSIWRLESKFFMSNVRVRLVIYDLPEPGRRVFCECCCHFYQEDWSCRRRMYRLSNVVQQPLSGNTGDTRFLH